MRLSNQPQTNKWLTDRGGAGLMVVLITVHLCGQLAGDRAYAQASRSVSGATMTGLQTPRRAVLVDIEEEIRQQNPNQNGGHFEMTAEQLDHWVFENSYEMARQNHQTLIKLEIAQLDAACGLSPEQKRLLQLAGAGELQRFANIRTVLQARYAGRTYDQNKLGEVFQELQPYQALFQRRSLGSESLVIKLLPTLLDESQSERFSDWLEKRKLVEQRRQIDAAVALIEQQVPLTITQREQLVELFQSHTRPISADASERHISTGLGRLAQLNDVPPAAFQAFLDPPQWEALQAVFLPQRGHMRWLKEQNLLLEQSPTPAKQDAPVKDATIDAAVPGDQEVPQ